MHTAETKTMSSTSYCLQPSLQQTVLSLYDRPRFLGGHLFPSKCCVGNAVGFLSYDMADPYSFSDGEYLVLSIGLSGNSERLFV